MKPGNCRNGIRMLWVTAVITGGLFGQSTTGTYTYNGLPLPIFTDAANLITVAYIVVPNALSMSKVTAQVQIQYPNSGDLQVYLFSPNGTRTILLQNDCNVQNVDTTFDDSASSAWKDFCPVEAGRGPFRPDQPLANFNGDSSFGTWSLAVENNESDSRSGWITGFSLTITGTPQLTPITTASEVVNAASLGGAGTIAPGEVISIFGVGLGPLPGISAPTGAIPTTLAGSSVLINGVAAPIFYASAYRVDAQVPFGLTPGGTATVQVNSSSGSGGVLTLNTVDAVPGVYTTGFGGLGAVNAINQDGSVNSVLHPAAKGSYLTLYANGLGAVNPALVAGAIPPGNPLSFAAGSVTASIGGLPATVQFAGAAPGYPGLYQINLVVPPTVLSGTRALSLYVNGEPSQAGATVQIQ
jgi:uncharacterized protein (TIGR03437 family)